MLSAESMHPENPRDAAQLWRQDNRFAWGVSCPDANLRTPEACAKLLKQLGFKRVAMDWRSEDPAVLEARIEALKHHGIEIIAWGLPLAGLPTEPANWKDYLVQDDLVLRGLRPPVQQGVAVGALLEIFKRHAIHPQLWLIQPIPRVSSTKRIDELPMEERNRRYRSNLGRDLTQTPQEQALRIEQEADRLQALAKLAAPYGVTISLYKHGGWLGISDNQIALIEQLKKRGVNDVGIVYPFLHARDEVDEVVDFRSHWRKIRPYVAAVIVTGMHAEGVVFPLLYPSEGSRELEMMRVIQESRWQGSVGLAPEKGRGLETDLRNGSAGIDWLAKELASPGSGGPRPFSR